MLALLQGMAKVRGFVSPRGHKLLAKETDPAKGEKRGEYIPKVKSFFTVEGSYHKSLIVSHNRVSRCLE